MKAWRKNTIPRLQNDEFSWHDIWLRLPFKVDTATLLVKNGKVWWRPAGSDLPEFLVTAFVPGAADPPTGEIS